MKPASTTRSGSCAASAFVERRVPGGRGRRSRAKRDGEGVDARRPRRAPAPRSPGRSVPAATTSGRRAGSSRIACSVVPLPEARTTSRRHRRNPTRRAGRSLVGSSASSLSSLSSPVRGIGERTLDRTEQPARRGRLAAGGSVRRASSDAQHRPRRPRRPRAPTASPSCQGDAPNSAQPPGADRPAALPGEDGAEQRRRRPRPPRRSASAAPGSAARPAMPNSARPASERRERRPAPRPARSRRRRTAAAPSSGNAGSVPCAVAPTVTPLPTPTAKPGPAR